jgi:hypothetical protein
MGQLRGAESDGSGDGVVGGLRVSLAAPQAVSGGR